jgi:Flp pilus assembly pilin Flp
MFFELVRNESGQGMLEYVLIVSLVAMVVMIGVSALGQILNDNYYTLFNNEFDN